MIIQNNSAFPVLIPDIVINNINSYLVLPGGATVTIFNSSANSSAVLTALINDRIILNLGSLEPTTGFLQVAGFPGPQGPKGIGTVYSNSITNGVIAGAKLTLPLPGILATDTICGIVVNMNGNPGRVGGQVSCLSGYESLSNNQIVLDFVDVPPVSGTVFVTVNR